MIRTLVPRFILDKSANRVYQGEFKGLVVVIDLKGFTALSEKMMTRGKQGIEILSQVINQLFGSSIDLIYQHQGFVSTFAGDSFTAIFPIREKILPRSINGILAIREVFKKRSSVDTPVGQFNISMRIGLSKGLVNWRIIKGNKYHTYLFSGQVFRRSNFNCGKAEENQVVADYDLLEDRKDFATELFDEYFMLIKNESVKLNPSEYYHQPLNEIDRLADFFPVKLLTSRINGEYREVISCFIEFKENDDLQSEIEYILELSHFYQGYFNKVEFGDKGYIGLILFGAPWGVEKSTLRAGKFALDLIKKFPGKFKIGMSRGKAFTGFIGCEIREEYTGIGVSLNLAARLMQIADWGQILIDDKFHQDLIKNCFEVKFMQEVRIKGFKKSKKVYRLYKFFPKEISSLKKIPRLFVGRETLIENLNEQLKILEEGKFAGLTALIGRAGIGKTTLIDQLKINIKTGFQKSSFQWIELKCDELLPNSFNPVLSYFKSRLDVDERYSTSQNKKNFQKNFKDLTVNLTDNQITSELNKNSWIIAQFLEVEIDRKSSVSDPKILYDNFIFMVKDMFKALALHKPLIVTIDDAQWIDSDTVELLNNLIRNIGNIPLWIIFCTREKNLLKSLNLDQQDLPIQETYLDELNETYAKILIRDLLAEQTNRKSTSIPEQTLNKIYETAQGNPFYIEQLVYYLSENKVLDGHLNLISSDQIDIPSNIHEIIITRIDRLSEDLKQAIQVASVLGREFAVEILTEMLKGLPVRKYLIQGEQQLIWEALTEIKYIFKHALIREVAYQMQLEQRIIELHLLAARIIENKFTQYSDESISKLAYHYHSAEIIEKAELYLIEATCRSVSKFRNSEALNYLIKLKKYYHPEGVLADPQKYFDILLKLKSIHYHIGQVNQYRQAIKEIIKIAEKSDRSEWIIKAGIENFRLNVESGEYPRAFKILQNIEKQFNYCSDKVLYAEYIHWLAYYYDMICEYPQALRFYQQELNLAEKYGNINIQSRVLGNIGAIYMVQGELNKALNYLQKQMDLAEKHHYVTLKISALNNIGVCNKEMGNFTKALQCYQRNLQYSLENGYKQGESLSYGNIGEIYFYQGKNSLALKYFQKNLYIARELGDEKIEGNILYNMSILYDLEYKYHQARDHLLQAEKIFKKYQNDLALCYLYGTLGDNHYNQEKFFLAEKFYRKKVNISRKLSLMDMTANGLCSLARVYRRKGEIKQAEINFINAIKIAEDKSLFKSLSKILYFYADFCYEQKNYEKAFKILKKSLSFSEQMEKNDQIMAELLKAKLIAITDRNRAIEILESLTEQAENIEISAEIYFNLFKITGEKQHKDKAIKFYRKLVNKTSLLSFKDILDWLNQDTVNKNQDY